MLKQSRAFETIKFCVCSILVLVSIFFMLNIKPTKNIFAQSDCSYMSEQWFSGLGISKEQVKEIQFVNSLPQNISVQNQVDISAKDENGTPADGSTAEVSAYYTQGENTKIYVVCSQEIYAPKRCKDLFSGFTNLTNITFQNFNTSKATNFQSMFSGCSSLITLDLSQFDTRGVTDTMQMFDGCTNLEEVNLSSFVTPGLSFMEGMFRNCHSLKSLNLSNFNVSNVTYMNELFSCCYNLETLNLGEFYNIKIRGVESMFNNCLKLKEIDLKNMETSNVRNMQNMFYGCVSLEEVNISKFDTSNVDSMQNMFYNCFSLKTLDLSNFDMKNILAMGTDNMLYQTTSLTQISLPYNVRLSIKLTNKMVLTTEDNKQITYEEINRQNCAKQGEVLTIKLVENKIGWVTIFIICLGVILVVSLTVVLILKNKNKKI